MERTKNISKAMISYMKRAREHKEFLMKETKEYDEGKRHLANMMGIEASQMTQEHVDDAIKYLFPSALFEKRARPLMKHPDILYAAKKEAVFDGDGRPNHYLFYTVKPNYNEALSKLRLILQDLNKYEDEQLAEGIISPAPNSPYQDPSRTWVDHNKMEQIFIESLKPYEYDYIIRCLDKLVKHPYSARATEFINKFTEKKPEQSLQFNLPEVITDPVSGQVYTEMIARHREHKLKVKTVLNGSGKIDIEGMDILYFTAPYMRRALMAPLLLSNMLDKVDIIARYHLMPRLIGEGAVASAIRYALSLSIAAVVDPPTRERLRLAGLLALDTRLKERKKFGQEGARRKYTWKKR